MDDNIINVLLVESNVEDRDFVINALSGCSNSVTYHTEYMNDLAGAVKLLNQRQFDIVLLDIKLPDSTGTDTVRQIHDSKPYVPVIVMTDLADEENAVRAIKSGADDYLVKGKIFKDVLGRSIRYAIERRRERQKAEKALTEERNKARKYLDVAQVILVALNADQEVALINKKGCEILGYSEDEIIGRNWCDNFVPITIREEVRNLLSDILNGHAKTAEFCENPVLTKDGTERLVAWKNTVLTDRAGRIESILSSGEDITERKLAEEQKNSLLREVKSANQQLKDFAYIVSHDLKAPLRGIKTLVNWISTDYASVLDDEGKEHMSLLVARVDRMHNLIDGVLQYSRVGRIREEIVCVDLALLVPEVIDMIAPPDCIEIVMEDALPVVEFEKTRIMQVFQNLLTNAVKYMDKPHGIINISCVEENNFWKFSIADNGPGIEKEHFERIFQMFQTLAPRDEVESTGIGLTIAKKIVEFYEGKIWVDSKPGCGSTFFFTLPKELKEIENAKLQANYAY